MAGNEPHGTFTVKVKNNIIFVTATGSFNEEGTKLQVEKMKEAVNSLDGKPFGLFMDATKLEGRTPESYELFEEHSKWSHDRGLLARAVLVKSVILYEIARGRMPSVLAQNEKVFSDRERALSWLTKQLSQG